MKSSIAKTCRNPFRRTAIHILLILITAVASPSRAASLSELLEKGVFTEETKGDLDAAIEIYQQIVSQSKSAEILGAQAQYRLGQCYHKKKNYSAATAAFERLIKEFPSQKELVAKARQYLPTDLALNAPPWVAGEIQQLVYKFPTGFKIGTVAYAVDQIEANGRKFWRTSSRTAAGGVQGISSVLAEADTLRPVSSRWKHSLIGDVEAHYKPGQVELRQRGKSEVKTVDFEGIVYDNEEVIQLMRRLPLEVGYQVTLPIITTLGGGMTIHFIPQVTAKEVIEVEAGKIECFKVESNIKQTFWYSTDEHRYLVKLEAGGVVAELQNVHQRSNDTSAKFQDSTAPISLAAPAGWLFFKFDRSADGSTEIAIIEPEALATTRLSLESLADLRPQEKASVRGWAQAAMEREGKQHKDFQIRTDGWSERVLDGHAAISVIADATFGNERKTIYGIFAFAGRNAVRILAIVDGEAFDEFKPSLDAVIASCRLK